MQLLLLLIIIISLLFFAFSATIYPLWAIIHCAGSQKRSGLSKTLWVAAIIFTWPFASFLYGLFASGKKAFRVISALAIASIFISVFGTMQMVEQGQGIIQKELNATLDNFADFDTSELLPEESENLKEHIRSLKAGLTGKIDDIERTTYTYREIGHFLKIIQDKKISGNEYNSFIKMIESRPAGQNAEHEMLEEFYGSDRFDKMERDRQQ